jgi:hypothetical protein
MIFSFIKMHVKELIFKMKKIIKYYIDMQEVFIIIENGEIVSDKRYENT